MLLQFARRLRERQVRPQVRYHPLQRPRAAAVMHFGTLRKGAPSLRPLPILRLIYFDIATKKAILGKIHDLLRPGGYLFLGGAESTINLDERFERVVLDKSTCYRRVQS